MKAERLRFELGLNGFLASWVQRDDGIWLARVSCDRYHKTVHGYGRTRTLALRAATVKLTKAIIQETYDQSVPFERNPNEFHFSRRFNLNMPDDQEPN